MAEADRAARDWVAWHAAYADPRSNLSQRLEIVQELLSGALDRAPAGPLRLASACAGEGRDVLGVLPGHPRRDDVTAVLVELHRENAAAARRLASDAGLADRVTVVEGDAGVAAAYRQIVPVDVLLLVGIFGNIGPAHIARTVLEARSLCAPGASVLWTRGVFDGEPDLNPTIRRWFAAAGFAEERFVEPTTHRYRVGWYRMTAEPTPYDPDAELFRFAAR